MLEYKSKLYCLMNSDMKFIDEDFNLTDDIREAIGWRSEEEAEKERLELDEPEEFKIVIKWVEMKIIKIIE